MQRSQETAARPARAGRAPVARDCNFYRCLVVKEQLPPDVPRQKRSQHPTPLSLAAREASPGESAEQGTSAFDVTIDCPSGYSDYISGIGDRCQQASTDFSIPLLCGADGARTRGLRLAKPALSQLSYSPSESDRHGHRHIPVDRGSLHPSEVGPGRVELPTLPLSGVRSSRLSYGPGRERTRPPCLRSLKTK